MSQCCERNEDTYSIFWQPYSWFSLSYSWFSPSNNFSSNCIFQIPLARISARQFRWGQETASNCYQPDTEPSSPTAPIWIVRRFSKPRRITILCSRYEDFQFWNIFLFKISLKFLDKRSGCRGWSIEDLLWRVNGGFHDVVSAIPSNFSFSITTSWWIKVDPYFSKFRKLNLLQIHELRRGSGGIGFVRERDLDQFRIRWHGAGKGIQHHC